MAKNFLRKFVKPLDKKEICVIILKCIIMAILWGFFALFAGKPLKKW